MSLLSSINANAEGLRDKFVSHEGKKTLKIESFGDRHNFDYAGMADTFSEMLKRDVCIGILVIVEPILSLY